MPPTCLLLQELRSSLDSRSQEQNQQKIATDKERKFQEKHAAQLVSWSLAGSPCCYACYLLHVARPVAPPWLKQMKHCKFCCCAKAR